MTKAVVSRCGVIMQHGCGHKIFLEKKTLENICAITCGCCKGLILLSTFDSTLKAQLLKHCEEWKEEDIEKSLKEKWKK